MLNRIVIVAGIIAAMILWFGPFTVPGWAVVAFVLVLFLMAVVITAKRVRAERGLAHTFWKALMGR